MGEFDCVVTDVLMDGMTGIELCERIAGSLPDLPVIVVTTSSRLETAIAAIRVAAYDFITKPIHLGALAIAVERAVERRGLRREVKVLRRLVSEQAGYDELFGSSVAMRKVYGVLEQMARSDASVLITGESGTGKELVARALHRKGPRAGGSFVAVNCAAMPETLLESELFGHEKGAFTDARVARDGLFLEADGGVLLLDEIGEMPLGLQSKLLRVLEQRTVRPVGGRKEIPFNVRLVASTNRDLEAAIEARQFREDLYYRVNILHLALPPLRARGRDVLVLAQHFLERFAAASGKPVSTISAAAAEKLLAYSWPGNVRELRNCIERAVALTRNDQILVDDLPEKLRAYRASELVISGNDSAGFVSMDEVERRYILRVLEAVGGNKRQAARVLGFDRKTLYRKLERYGLESGGGTD